MSANSTETEQIDMYKNQLQELAQRSCFNLPSYASIKEGPNHAPRFKASVNFNGEIFESPDYCTTLRQAEHSAAEVALNVLSTRGPSRSLTARVLDETGIYKNLLQETAHRAGLKLPVYTTVRSGPGHVPTFTCSVELAGLNFTGEPAKTKKQAEKNAAIAAWSALNKMPRLEFLSASSKVEIKEGQVRKRDQNPSKRTSRVHKDGTGFSSLSSSSSSNISSRDERLKLIDLIMDLGQEGSLAKDNTFASLVPPPPPQTASKILPPPNRPIPVQAKSSRSCVVIPPLLGDHQKDEEEWLGNGKQNVLSKNPTSTADSKSSSVCGTSSTYKSFPISSGKLTPFSESPMSSDIKFPPASSAGHIPIRSVHNSGQYLPHKIAPAVQIRSVIPVCSAPRPPPSKPPSTTTKEAKSQSKATLVSTQPQGSEISSAASSKLNDPRSTLLGSELNRLQ